MQERELTRARRKRRWVTIIFHDRATLIDLTFHFGRCQEDFLLLTPIHAFLRYRRTQSVFVILMMS